MTRLRRLRETRLQGGQQTPLARFQRSFALLLPSILQIGIAFGGIGLRGCYSTGEGTSPPPTNFYFPVGLAVSQSGNVLYAVNSDFDLQWNGGTLQSYDLHQIRRDTAKAVASPPSGCPSVSLQPGQELALACAPPVDSTAYVRDSAIIGAFATDLQLSKFGNRLFVPVRGDTSLTWADVAVDDGAAPVTADYAPFKIDCGSRINNRCDAAHHAGTSPDEPGNSRHITMPGEPFGMAQSEDGQAIVVTHQADTKISLFSTGLASGAPKVAPSLQFVLNGLQNGGNGIVAVPHDPLAFPPCDSSLAISSAACPSPASRQTFLETNRASAVLELLRYYPDDGTLLSSSPASSTRRPYLIKERDIGVTTNANGSDSRGIVIDPSPRMACAELVRGADPTATPPRTAAMVDAEKLACARRPARIFVANRTPASLIIGEVGGLLGSNGSASGTPSSSYDAGSVAFYESIPLAFGPSKLYLAPIVDSAGKYSLRVFIVCFDASVIYVYDPDTRLVENIIRVGPGPFAMAFDPFDIEKVARREVVADDPRDADLELGSAGKSRKLKTYRFAYVASFTKSYVQVLDLDNSHASSSSTFERVVYTLGVPTSPKGS